MKPPLPASDAILQKQLQEAAPRREVLLGRLTSGALVVAWVASEFLAPRRDARAQLLSLAVVLVLVGYHAILARWIGRGAFHPAIPWFNTAVEVSIPMGVLALIASAKGPAVALTIPLAVLATLAIGLSAMRYTEAIAFFAGAVAASEFVALYVVVMAPQLDAASLPTLQRPAVLMWPVNFMLTGLASAAIARYHVNTARDALAAIRQQDLFGKYLLNERVGAGGMAEVFRAVYSPEGGFEKIVAVKRVLPEFSANPRFVEMFLEEARLLSRLSHPNIVQILDVGRFQGNLIIAMEYVEGVSLGRLLATLGPLPFEVVAFLAAELGAALDHLHALRGADGTPLQMVHRDVNPPNVLVSRLGEVKLADFGVARACSSAGMASEPLIGKLGYFAPEQVLGQPFDGRADLYALGVTLHAALTNVSPADGKGTNTALADAVRRELEPPSRVREGIPASLDALVMDLLEASPAKRLATGGAVRERALQVAKELPGGEGALAALVEALSTLPQQPQMKPPEPALVPTVSMRPGR